MSDEPFVDDGADQERETLEVVKLGTESDCGWVGAESTTTVVVALLAERVYIVVEVGETTTEPVDVADWLPMPLSRETVVAPVVVHERVELAPLLITEEEAVKDVIAGGATEEIFIE